MRKFETDREALQDELLDISKDIGTQKAGYDFESWFYKLLDYAEIINRRPYKIDGRQIDGSLTLDGTTYLVELKFTKNQSSAEAIDSFKAKVDKMADNTMGIFVSMSGYSRQAIKEASGRKTTLILLESSHLFLFLQGITSFEDIIRRCRRHVSQTAEALLTVDKFHLHS
ncbi:restriction endonuclease [Acinetobacter guillouiae]|uniref:restriction endonuclease n=1 Tax=Acinetobacter guillouiae TaxID=106649 RepID=UPI003C6FCFB2